MKFVFQSFLISGRFWHTVGRKTNSAVKTKLMGDIALLLLMVAKNKSKFN